MSEATVTSPSGVKWRINSLLRAADKTQTKPPAKVIAMGPRLGVESLDALAMEIMEAMEHVRVAKDEEARAQDQLEETVTQRHAREQELCELQERMFLEVAKLGVVSGPPPIPGGENG